MSSHNNNSFSSLPFTPSSTSSLSSGSSYNVHAQQSIPHHQLLPGFSAKNKMAAAAGSAAQPGVSANSWQLSQQQLEVERHEKHMKWLQQQHELQEQQLQQQQLQQQQQ